MNYFVIFVLFFSTDILVNMLQERNMGRNFMAFRNCGKADGTNKGRLRAIHQVPDDTNTSASSAVCPTRISLLSKFEKIRRFLTSSVVNLN